MSGHLKKSGLGITEYLFQPLLQLAATPFLIVQLGTVQYGSWVLLNAIVGLGSIGGLGMGLAAAKSVSAYNGKADLQSAAQVVKAAAAVSLVGSLILALIVGTVGHFMAADFFAGMGSPEAVAQLFLFAAIFILVGQVESVYSGTIRGMERFDWSAMTEAAFSSVGVLSACAAAWWTKQLTPVLVTMLVITVTRIFVKSFLAAKLLATTLLVPRWIPKHVRDVLPFGSWGWLQSLVGVFFGSFDRFVVGSILGADALARYGVCLQLAQQIHAVPVAGTAYVFPMISRSLNAGEPDAVRRIALSAIALAILMSTGIALPLILFSSEILSLWIGADFAARAASTLGWLASAYLVLGLSVAPHFVLLGFGKARLVALTNILGGVAAAVACLVLVPHYGLTGAAQSRFVYAIPVLGNYFMLMRYIFPRIR